MHIIHHIIAYHLIFFILLPEYRPSLIAVFCSGKRLLGYHIHATPCSTAIILARTAEE